MGLRVSLQQGNYVAQNGTTTLSITTFSMTTLSITIKKNNNQYNGTQCCFVLFLLY